MAWTSGPGHKAAADGILGSYNDLINNDERGHEMDEDFNEYGHYEDDAMEWETEQVYQDMLRERDSAGLP